MLLRLFIRFLMLLLPSFLVLLQLLCLLRELTLLLLGLPLGVLTLLWWHLIWRRVRRCSGIGLLLLLLLRVVVVLRNVRVQDVRRKRPEGEHPVRLGNLRHTAHSAI